MSRVAWTCALTLLITACSGPPTGTSDVALPSSLHAQFGVVNDALGYSCGTLDCHGQQGRNLRVWSKYGMRLPDPSATVPPNPGTPPTTSQAEIDATYASVIGLEPELFSQVVRDHGNDPQRLTMIRKAVGTEAHKGHKVMSASGNDPLYVCIISWLAQNLDAKNSADAKNIADCKKMAPALGGTPPKP